MGYECPVCERPQADRRHLADHLAVTAVIRGGDHEAWLDEHVAGWEEMGPDDLGPVAAEYATERDYPQVFEDTTGHSHGPGRSDAKADPTLEDHLARAGPRGPGAGREEMIEAMLDAETPEDDADE